MPPGSSTIYPYTYLPRETLSTYLLTPSSSPSLAIIDVRDDDHIGGHIVSSTHVPSSTLDHRIPELVRTLWEKETVVFHCALSQQRGPRAAARYAAERGKWVVNVKKGEKKKRKGEEKEEEGGGEEEEEREQKIYVLDGGFVKWQEKYGRDTRLTEAFAPDIWVDYY